MDGLAHPGAVAVPSIAAESGSKARMSEHTDVRVRAGPLSARSAGDSDSLDANQNAASGAKRVFGYFLRAQKVTRAA